MTIPTEVAAALAEMRELKVPNWPAGRILGDLADRLESALTKAEAVEPVATVCFRGDCYASGNMIEVQLQIVPGTELPIGTKLYAHASSAEPAVKYTTGHCKNKAQPGGCQLHNLQCGYPSCDREPIQSPSVPVESLCSDCPPSEYPTEETRCAPCPRRREPVASVPDGWMPISSAPKDGTFVHVYEPGWDHEQMDQEIARYSSSSKKWVWAHAGMSMNPTHWKPLSAPPTNQEGAAP